MSSFSFNQLFICGINIQYQKFTENPVCDTAITTIKNFNKRFRIPFRVFPRNLLHNISQLIVHDDDYINKGNYFFDIKYLCDNYAMITV